MEREKNRLSALREFSNNFRSRLFNLKTIITTYGHSNNEATHALSELQQEKLPESLEYWTKEQHNQASLSTDDASRQILDLYTLPEKTWGLFRQSQYHINPYLDYEINEAEALRDLNSKDRVKNYFIEELVENHDPYCLLDNRIDMPGHGIESLYDRLLGIASLKSLTSQEKIKVYETLGFWEEAALDIICDPNLYFIKTAIGNEGTISELLGSMIVHKLHIGVSLNIQDGRYRERLQIALDYDGIVNGKYKMDNHSSSFARQRSILNLLYKAQGQNNRFESDFWQSIGKNEDFLPVLHWIAVKEGYPNANQLLLESLDFAWKKAKDGQIMYDLTAYNYLHTHFDGITAADKFLANPSMKFMEKFHKSRFNVQEHYLSDFRQLDKNEKDFLILLDCNDQDGLTIVRYAHVGKEYSENTIYTLNSSDNSTFESEDRILSTVLKMVDELKTFKRNYLIKLNAN